MSLDPLQYCKCVPDSQVFDTFCAPPTTRITTPAENPTIGIELEIKGEDGATCESNDQCLSDVCDAGTCLTPQIAGRSFEPRGGINIGGDSLDADCSRRP